MATSSKCEFLVNGKYRLVRKIGSGSFGDIYLGINTANGEVCSMLIVVSCCQLLLASVFYCMLLASVFYCIKIKKETYI